MRRQNSLLPLGAVIKCFYYMASSVSRQDEPSLCCVWLHYSLCPTRKLKFPESHVMNPLLTMLVRSDGWKNWLSSSFASFYEPRHRLRPQTHQKELDQYLVHLTPRLVNDLYIALHCHLFLWKEYECQFQAEGIMIHVFILIYWFFNQLLPESHHYL